MASGIAEVRFKVLVVDDSEAIRKLVFAALTARGYDVFEATDGVEGLAMAERVRPDLVILDVMMPKRDGIETCRLLRERQEMRMTPVIFLSARGSPEERTVGLTAGADDYMTKPFSIGELSARVERLVRRTEVILDANPTTRLPGGASIHGEIARRVKHNLPCAVGYVDLDNFKAFNDRYGFEYGDRVIRFAGQVLREVVLQAPEAADDDFAGHIGGDDFLMICHPDAIEARAQALVSEFRKARPVFHNDAELAQGYFLARDRSGEMREYPLLSLTVAAITRPIAHPAELSEWSAELKNRAKMLGGDRVVVDRRHEDRVNYSGPKILIADADRARSLAMIRLLIRNGYQAVWAPSGPDVIKESARLRPAAVVLFGEFPYIPRAEVERLMASLEATKALRVVAGDALVGAESPQLERVLDVLRTEIPVTEISHRPAPPA